MRELHTQNPENVNFWAGIIGENIIGPIVIDGSLNGETYLALLQNNVVPTMGNLYPAERNLQLPDRRIGETWFCRMACTITRLTPLDFFLWEYVKSTVYKTKPDDLADLRRRITLAIKSITPQMLINTGHKPKNRVVKDEDEVKSEHLDYLLEKCRQISVNFRGFYLKLEEETILKTRHSENRGFPLTLKDGHLGLKNDHSISQIDHGSSVDHGSVQYFTLSTTNAVLRNSETIFGRNGLRKFLRKVRETGTLMGNRSHPRSGVHKRIAAVAQSVRENPRTSIRHRAQQLNVSRTSLRRILHKDLGLFAYNGVEQLARHLYFCPLCPHVVLAVLLVCEIRCQRAFLVHTQFFCGYKKKIDPLLHLITHVQLNVGMLARIDVGTHVSGRSVLGERLCVAVLHEVPVQLNGIAQYLRRDYRGLARQRLQNNI
ncbi:hypothetical protein NQ318_004069 [Aromia moschata]|uniref:Uncharacterized protein n=1 Tax=Aromia moschata TaxID=1265417 RepID=A0AAV8Z950_9CUCU|nr:hypothetical protein NQ318_004069 [Aromia moschata]